MELAFIRLPIGTNVTPALRAEPAVSAIEKLQEEKHFARRQPRFRGKISTQKFSVKNYMSAKIDNGWLHG